MLPDYSYLVSGDTSGLLTCLVVMEMEQIRGRGQCIHMSDKAGVFE